MNTAYYWEQRYKSGGNSGRGLCLDFKGEVLRRFIKKHHIKSIIDLGCGDGRMVKLFDVNDYVGLDISPTAVDICKKAFAEDKNKVFRVYEHPIVDLEPKELTLSLDVIFHLLEDETYSNYMEDLFNYATKYVIVFSSDTEGFLRGQARHLRQHKFTDWVKDNRKDWELLTKINNRFPYNPETGEGAISDFYIFKHKKL